MARFDPMDAARLIAVARVDAGIGQHELARRAGLSQPNLAAMESGRRRPSDAMLERILEAADYRPSIPLEQHAEELRALARRQGLDRPRVFGSVVRGEDHFDSDIDLLVAAPENVSIVAIAEFAAAVERLTGFRAEVITERGAIGSEPGRRLIATAVPL